MLSEMVLFSGIEDDDEIENSEASSMWKVEIDVVLVCILAASGGVIVISSTDRRMPNVR